MTRELSLPELVSSRICHDLSGPIGALGTGVELLEMTSQTVSPELALLRDGLRLADARLRLVRLAFGSAKQGEVSVEELSVMLAAVHAGSRIGVRWLGSGPIPRERARLGCLLHLCMERALPRGGDVTIQATDLVAVEAVAGNVQLDPALSAILTGAPSDGVTTPRDVQFPLARAAAEELGLRIAVAATETGIEMSAGQARSAA